MLGFKYNLWTVLAPAAPRKGRVYWFAVCDCGTFRVVRSENLKRDHTKSCGCQKLAATKACNTRHGLTEDYRHTLWIGIRQRCNNPNNQAYVDYGGRGITVCAEWEEFSTFLRDVGERPSKAHSLDRKDNSKGYSPDNVRWATKSEQAYNRRSARKYLYRGRLVTVEELLPLTSVSKVNLSSRLNVLGFTVEEVLRPSGRVR